MTKKEYSGLILEKKDRVGIITLNIPDKLNPIRKEMHEVSLPQALEDITKDDSIRVVIITGAGRAFSAGGDIQDPHTIWTQKTYSSPLSNSDNLPFDLRPFIATLSKAC